VEYVNETKTARFGTYGRGIWDFDVSEVSSTNETIKDITLNIYPNPSSEILNINLTAHSFDGNVNLNIINNVGFVIRSQNVSPNQESIKLAINDLKSGVYFVEIRDKNSRIIGKFTKI
jgi:hypothetical protein